MRYVYLVGAPKTQKSAVAKKLAAQIPNSRVLDIPKPAELRKLGFPLGNLVDYRIETALATQRAIDSFSTTPKNEGVEILIVVNSPLTNLAYAVKTIDGLTQRMVAQDDPEFEQWFVTVGYLWRLVQDSVWNDLFFFLPGNDGTDFAVDIEETLKATLTNIGLEYRTLEGTILQKTEKAAKIVAEAKWLT